MCGRFALVTDLNKIAGQFNARNTLVDFKANLDVRPGQRIPAVIQRGGQNIIDSFLWGLIPSWAKDPSIGRRLINARAETIDEKPSFRSAFRQRRCLIIADGFYEWKQEGNKKVPWYFYLKSGEPFGLAGLYESWMSPEKELMKTCTIITTEANRLMLPIHDRMPVIVPRELEQIWLSEKINDRATLLSVLNPYPDDRMDCQSGIPTNFALRKKTEGPP